MQRMSNNANRPAFWHYSSHATWSDDEALSPTHSLELVDNSATAAEEWRSYATDVPAGEDRSFQLRWFWKYDVAAGGEFRARLRLSNDGVTSLDLTNPLVGAELHRFGRSRTSSRCSKRRSSCRTAFVRSI